MDEEQKITLDSNVLRITVSNSNHLTHTKNFYKNNNDESKNFMTWQYNRFTKEK